MYTLPEVNEEDIYQRWYQMEDYNAFEVDNRDIVTCINQKLKEYCRTKDLSKVPMNELRLTLLYILQNTSTNPLLSYQILGLEQFLYGPKYMYERRQETMHHNVMVLEMYDVQRATLHYHPHVLRKVSERFSIANVERAIQRAMPQPQQHTTTTTTTGNMTIPTQPSSSSSSTFGSVVPTVIRDVAAIRKVTTAAIGA
jgi:hypothetical protein